MPIFRAAFVSSCLLSLAAFGCGGGDDEGGGSGGGTGGQLATGGAGGAAGSATGGSASGGTPGTSVCPGVKGSCATADANKCAEYGGTQGDEAFTAYEANCQAAQSNVWSTGACTDFGKVGSCKLDTPGGPCNTIVFYEPITSVDAQSECDTLAGEWVP